MNEPKRQIKFECSEQFYKRLMDEKLQRRLTLQQLTIRALERYFVFPESVHREVDETVQRYGIDLEKFLKEYLGSMRRVLEGKTPKGLPEEDPEEVEREHLAFAIGALFRSFPLEKLRLTKELLTLDAKHYQSARINPSKANSRGKSTKKKRGQ